MKKQQQRGANGLLILYKREESWIYHWQTRGSHTLGLIVLTGHGPEDGR
jgi:hypothetical protein